jgi:hypothetical protein
VHLDRGLDRPVEPHLVQVDVRDVAAHRMALVVLEDRRMDGRLAFDDDVEHGVQAGVRVEGGAERALLDHDRARSGLAVEHARDQALLAQAPRLGRAEPLTFLDLEAKSVSGHSGG